MRQLRQPVAVGDRILPSYERHRMGEPVWRRLAIVPGVRRADLLKGAFAVAPTVSDNQRDLVDGGHSMARLPNEVRVGLVRDLVGTDVKLVQIQLVNRAFVLVAFVRPHAKRTGWYPCRLRQKIARNYTAVSPAYSKRLPNNVVPRSDTLSGLIIAET